MTIDIERLGTDRDYWKMVAPEGANFYFYMTQSPFFTPFFAKTAEWSDFSLNDVEGGWEGVKVDGGRYHVFNQNWQKVDRPAIGVYWSGAPEGATHLDKNFNLFCDEGGFWDNEGNYTPLPRCGHLNWGTDRYMPRPEEPKQSEEKIMKLCREDLKTGMVVVMNDDEIGTILLGTAHGDIVAGDTWFPLDSGVSEGIISVYQPTANCRYVTDYVKPLTEERLSRSSAYTLVWSCEDVQKSIQEKEDELEIRLASVEELEKELRELRELLE